MGIEFSAYIPNEHPRVLECAIGGFVAQTIKVDFSNIKCPICGETMRLSQLDDSDYRNEVQERLIARQYSCNVFSVQRKHTYRIGVECPQCRSKLIVEATDIVEYGKRIKQTT